MPDDKCILDPERDCIGKAEAAKLEGRLSALEEVVAQNREAVKSNHDNASKTHKEFFNRIRELEKAEAIRGEQYKTILEKLDTLTASIAKVTSSVSDIQAEPGKNWKDFKGKVSWAVAGAIIAAIMAALLRVIGL